MCNEGHKNTMEQMNRDGEGGRGISDESHYDSDKKTNCSRIDIVHQMSIFTLCYMHFRVKLLLVLVLQSLGISCNTEFSQISS